MTPNKSLEPTMTAPFILDDFDFIAFIGFVHAGSRSSWLSFVR